MKKIILLTIIIVLLITFASYATIAYFTSQKKTTNIITSGNIDMKLHDETAGGQIFPQNGMEGLMPGDTVDKIVYVENTGSHSFYTRIKLVNSIMSEKEDVELDFSKIKLNIDESAWQKKDDGWYYYLSPVKAGEKTKVLFTKVTFDKGMGNECTNANVEIKVIAQAVQCANNGETIWQAQGWSEE